MTQLTAKAPTLSSASHARAQHALQRGVAAHVEELVRGEEADPLVARAEELHALGVEGALRVRHARGRVVVAVRDGARVEEGREVLNITRAEESK